MEKERIEKLLNKMLEATKNNKIEWEKNQKTESAFKASIAGNTAHIIKIRNSLSLILMNDSGDQIGQLSGIIYEHNLEKLHKLARIKALRINENLDEMDSYLDNLL